MTFLGPYLLVCVMYLRLSFSALPACVVAIALAPAEATALYSEMAAKAWIICKIVLPFLFFWAKEAARTGFGQRPLEST